MNHFTLLLVAIISLASCATKEVIKEDSIPPPDLFTVYKGDQLPGHLARTTNGADPWFVWAKGKGSFAAVYTQSDNEVYVALESKLPDSSEFAVLPLDTSLEDTFLSNYPYVYRVPKSKYEEFAKYMVKSLFNQNLESWSFQCRYS